VLSDDVEGKVILWAEQHYSETPIQPLEHRRPFDSRYWNCNTDKSG